MARLIQLPLVPSIAERELVHTVTAQTPVQRYSSVEDHDTNHVTDNLASRFQEFKDYLVMRWETWNLPYGSKVILTVVPLVSLLLLLSGLNEARVGNTAVGLLGLLASCLFRSKAKR